MNKLVRDKIPEIILKNGETPLYHILDDEEYQKELINKMMEEYTEVKNAKNREEILEECADLLEVILAYLKVYGYSLEDLNQARTLKRDKRGGFDKKIFLEKTI